MHFQGLALVWCIKHRILLLEACLSLHTSRAFSRSSSLASQLVVNLLPSGCPSCVSLCVLLASQVDMADSVGTISSISPCFLPAFLVATNRWRMLLCVSCLMSPQLSTCALQMKSGYLKNVTENAVGSKGTYCDVLVLQFTHTLYPRVKKCVVVCIWCRNRC